MFRNKTNNEMKPQTAALRQAREQRIHDAATHSVRSVLKQLETPMRGLSEDQVAERRAEYGANRVTHEKSRRLPDVLPGLSSIRSPRFCSVSPLCRPSQT